MPCAYKFFILFYILFACSVARAQKQQNIWYFSEKAGLDFNGGSVVSRNDGKMDGNEGTAGICDSSGAMLFYTNGQKVMNRKHVLMLNGDNIRSHTSSTQSSIIIPKPGSQRFFYLFTVDHCTWINPGDGAFRYSLVDMCGDRGFGEVVGAEKNVFMLDSVTEKLTAVRHQNGVDYWIIVHKHGSSAFYAYLLSAAGLSTNPVISSIGSVHDCNRLPANCPGGFLIGIAASAGQMKVSPDGKKLAIVTRANRYTFRELFDFNKSTGMLSNFINLNPSLDSLGDNYGISFSPDNTKLYMTKTGFGMKATISQYDLEAGGGNPAAIRGSEVVLKNTSASNNDAMQLGPDGKIYVSHQLNYLGIIHEPNKKGAACNYVENGIAISPGRFGLPGVVDAFDYSNTIVPVPRTSLRDTFICNGDPLVLKDTLPGSTYLWSTSATASFITVDTSGIYWVDVTSNEGCTNRDTIHVSSGLVPVSLLPADTTMCESDSIVLDAGYLLGGTYLWNTGYSSRSLTCDTPSKYWVTLTSPFTCPVTDSVNVQQVLKPDVELGPDTALCKIEGYILNAYSPGATYLWNTDSTTSFLSVIDPGKYEVQVTYKSCKVKDSVLITQKPVPIVDLGSDRKICAEDSITLDAGNTGSLFLWNNLSSAQIKTVKAPGLFYVSVTNAHGCQATDTLVIDTFASPVVSLGPDSAVCEDVSFVLDAGAGFDKYIWADGTGNRTLTVTATGTYFVTVEDQHTCKASDTVQVIIHSKPSVELGRQLLLCKPDTMIRPVGNFVGYLWQDSSTAPYFHITGYGVYSVTVTDEYNCSGTAIIEVLDNCPPDIFVPNAFTPNQDGNNDLFFPVVANVKSISWKIYNRWGQLLFETNDLKKGWDGLFENESATADVYVYVIHYVGTNDQSGMKRGNVTLIR